MRRPTRWLLTLVVTVAITALMLEVALRGLALLPGEAAGLASDPDVGIVGRPFVSSGSVTTNSRGFNDREHAQDAPAPRAVFVGDSFTFGVTPFDRNFPYLVEAALGGQGVFPVVNLGVPTTGPHEYLAMVRKRAIPLHPDWVVVTLFIGNDVQQAHPHYRTLIFLGNARLLYDPLRLGSRWQEYYLPRVVERAASMTPWFGPPSEESIRRCATPETAARLTPFLLRVYSYELAIYAEPEDELTRESFAGLRQSIATMADSAGPAGTRLLFALAPSELQLDGGLQASVLRCLRREHGRYDFGRPQRVLREYLDAQSWPYVDLTPALSRYPTVRTYSPHDTHWSAFGNQVAAEAIAEKLGDLRLTPHRRAAEALRSTEGAKR